MWCHIIIDLFSLIVEDHRLWFVDAKFYIFDASSWFARGEIDWEVKVVIICLRHEVFLQSEKFGLQLFIWNTVGFCCVALSPPLKGWSSRLWFYFGSADYSCYTLLHILYCHRSRALCCYSTEHFKLSDLKDNDLWKPNSSRETYEHVHHMKASTAAVHEYTLSPEPCSFSIPSPKQISFLVQFLNHWRILCTCEWICHNLPRLWQIYTRIKWKIGVKMATASQ